MHQVAVNRLARMIRSHRKELGMSANELARRAHVDPATVTRLERGLIATPQPDNLTAMANALGISATDLFVCADWIPNNQLPTFEPYLRAKYGNLAPDELAELETAFAKIAKRHGYDGNGPGPGEDE